MKLKGVYAAMLTPFYDDGSIQIEEMKRMTEFLIQSGVDGLFPVSSIGEGIHLSYEESCALMKAVIEQTGGRAEILPGATASCSYNSIKLAKAAREMGCSTVVIAPPYFYSTSEADIAKHYEDIIVQADVDVAAYNIPLFAPEITYGVVRRLAANPRVAAVKDSSGSSVNLMNIRDIMSSEHSKARVLIGREEMFLSGLMAGADGCMVGSASIIPEVIVAIKKAWEDKDIEKARIYQESVVPLVRAMFELPFPLGFKVAMKKRGFQMGGIRKSVDEPVISKETEKRIEECLSHALELVGVHEVLVSNRVC